MKDRSTSGINHGWTHLDGVQACPPPDAPRFKHPGVDEDRLWRVVYVI